MHQHHTNSPKVLALNGSRWLSSLVKRFFEEVGLTGRREAAKRRLRGPPSFISSPAWSEKLSPFMLCQLPFTA